MKTFVFFWSTVLLITFFGVKVVELEENKAKLRNSLIQYEKKCLEKVPEKYHSSLRFYQKYFNLPLHIIANIGYYESEWVETAFNYNKHNNTYDYGLFQLNSANYRWFNQKYFSSLDVEFNFKNPKHNMYVGLHYIYDLKNQFNGNMYLALCAYNWGIGNVLSGKTIPKIVDQYAKKILGEV